MRRSCATLALALALAGCATAPPPPPPVTTRQVVTTPDAVIRAARSALNGLGFTVVEDASGLSARLPAGAAPAWADCRAVLVHDYQSEFVRSDWARPQARMADVRVRATPVASGSEVRVDADFAARYVDRYRNFGFDRGCRSTGALEEIMLGAAQG